MPHYDYKCTECGYSFELFQKMTDKPADTCPKCKGKVKRLIGAGLSPIFKGSGFYQTDYKSNGSNGNGSSKSTSVPAAKTDKETKTESKSADKTK